jgi:hypothetical protein
VVGVKAAFAEGERRRGGWNEETLSMLSEKNRVDGRRWRCYLRRWRALAVRPAPPLCPHTSLSHIYLPVTGTGTVAVAAKAAAHVAIAWCPF